MDSIVSGNSLEAEYKVNLNNTTMKHTKQEFEALRNLIKMHSYNPANTMEGMEKQLDEILDNIDPYCEDY